MNEPSTSWLARVLPWVLLWGAAPLPLWIALVMVWWFARHAA